MLAIAFSCLKFPYHRFLQKSSALLSLGCFSHLHLIPGSTQLRNHASQRIQSQHHNDVGDAEAGASYVAEIEGCLREHYTRMHMSVETRELNSPNGVSQATYHRHTTSPSMPIHPHKPLRSAGIPLWATDREHLLRAPKFLLGRQDRAGVLPTACSTTLLGICDGEVWC